MKKGTTETVGETEGEYSSYFVLKLDEEYWKISKENGEVFEAELTEWNDYLCGKVVRFLKLSKRAFFL